MPGQSLLWLWRGGQPAELRLAFRIRGIYNKNIREQNLQWIGIPTDDMQNFWDDMRNFKVYGFTLSLIIGLMLSGCANMAMTGAADVDNKAFGAKKKFAVVSIASLKTFQGEKDMAQVFGNADVIPGANTQPIINKLSRTIIRALDSSIHFNLLSENSVLTSKAYKNLAEDERAVRILFRSEPVNVANNYRYVSDGKKYAKLARDMGVDGVIGIIMNFSISSGKESGTTMESRSGKKNYSSSVSVSIIAYNKDGDIIWKDSTLKEAEPGDTTATITLDTSNLASANLERLHPSAVEMGGEAMDVLLARLDYAMANKAVSSIENAK